MKFVVKKEKKRYMRDGEKERDGELCNESYICVSKRVILSARVAPISCEVKSDNLFCSGKEGFYCDC